MSISSSEQGFCNCFAVHLQHLIIILSGYACIIIISDCLQNFIPNFPKSLPFPMPFVSVFRDILFFGIRLARKTADEEVKIFKVFRIDFRDVGIKILSLRIV